MSRAKTSPTNKSTSVTIGPRVKAALSVAYRARRPALIEGETGIGKSEVIAELAGDLGIDCRVLDLSLLEPPDLTGLPIIHDGKTEFAVPSLLPTQGKGILLLEELNRADHTVQAPALQLLTARRLNDYELPEGWVPFAAINPEDGEYQVTPLDPALKARFLYLKVRADRRAWLEWAERNHVHPAVRRVASDHPHFLEDVAPRTWTYVSQVVSRLTRQEAEDETVVADLLGGYLPRAWVHVVTLELENTAPPDSFGGLRVGELLSEYHTNSDLRSRLAALREGGQTDDFFALTRRLLDVIDGPELLTLLEDGSFSLQGFDALAADLPGDSRVSLQKAAGQQPALAGLLALKPEDVVSGQFKPRCPKAATLAG